MTPQEITHYSELMARFEGLQCEIVSKEPYYTYGDWGYSVHNLEYIKSYDWLFRVWVKFRDLKFHYDADLEDDHYYKKLNIKSAICSDTIEEAFLELGKAIEWYNQIKK